MFQETPPELVLFWKHRLDPPPGNQHLLLTTLHGQQCLVIGICVLAIHTNSPKCQLPVIWVVSGASEQESAGNSLEGLRERPLFTLKIFCCPCVTKVTVLALGSSCSRR